MKNQVIFLIFAASVFSACAPQEETITLSMDSDAVVIDSAASLLGGVADEQDGASYSMSTPVPWKSQALIPIAYASSCSRPVYNSCMAGVKSESYVNCVPGLTSFTLNGTATLTYSNGTCSLSSIGSSVTRTYNLTLQGPRGGTVSLTSNSKADYNGNSYGGGGRLTVTGAGWNMEILGKHKSFVFKTLNLYDVSMRTLSPINVTGSLSRASRVLNSGQLQVNHNNAGFTALLTPQSLGWNNSCCYPVSGSLGVTFSGSRSGSATVSFPSCGQARVTENGQSKDIQLSYCE